MFTCTNKYTWETVLVYAVDSVGDRFLVSDNNEFVWKPMSDFRP